MKNTFALATALLVCAPAYADNTININPNKKSSSKWWQYAKIAIYATGGVGLSYYQFGSSLISSSSSSAPQQGSRVSSIKTTRYMPYHVNGALLAGAAIGIYDAIKNIRGKN